MTDDSLLGRAGPREGAVVNGIRFERTVGVGGLAQVWLGRDQGLDRAVAIKVLRADVSMSNPTEYALKRQRLEREAKLLAQFDHENIVKIYGLLDLGAGSIGLVMEYVATPTLREFIVSTGGRATWQQGAEVAAGAARALDVVHRPPRQLVHRDIKPDNLFWTPGTAVKVADFGVAQVPAEHTRTVHAIADHPGTPLYMSPEQVDRHPLLDSRSDQYSLAQCVYEMVAGHVFSETFPPLAEKRANLPAHFVAALGRALSRRREDRFPTCGEFAQALQTNVMPTIDVRPTFPGAATMEAMGRLTNVTPAGTRRARIATARTALALLLVGSVTWAIIGSEPRISSVFSVADALRSPTATLVGFPATANTPAPAASSPATGPTNPPSPLFSASSSVPPVPPPPTTTANPSPPLPSVLPSLSSVPSAEPVAPTLEVADLGTEGPGPCTGCMRAGGLFVNVKLRNQSSQDLIIRYDPLDVVFVEDTGLRHPYNADWTRIFGGGDAVGRAVQAGASTTWSLGFDRPLSANAKSLTIAFRALSGFNGQVALPVPLVRYGVRTPVTLLDVGAVSPGPCGTCMVAGGIFVNLRLRNESGGNLIIRYDPSEVVFVEDTGLRHVYHADWTRTWGGGDAVSRIVLPGESTTWSLGFERPLSAGAKSATVTFATFSGSAGPSLRASLQSETRIHGSDSRRFVPVSTDPGSSAGRHGDAEVELLIGDRRLSRVTASASKTTRVTP